MNIYYVYVYMHPKTKIPFYVGLGKGERYLSHLKEAKRETHKTTKQNKHKLNTIRKILSEGDVPIIQMVASEISLDAARKLEIYLICTIGRSDLNEGPLTNLTRGGEGVGEVSPESKQKRILTRKEKYEHDPQYRENMRNGQLNSVTNYRINHQFGEGNVMNRFKGEAHWYYGKHRDPETRRKISENHADCSGAGNSRALHITIKTPSGEKIECFGNFKQMCQQLGLSYVTMHRTFKKRIFPSSGPCVGYDAYVEE